MSCSGSRMLKVISLTYWWRVSASLSSSGLAAGTSALCQLCEQYCGPVSSLCHVRRGVVGLLLHLNVNTVPAVSC